MTVGRSEFCGLDSVDHGPETYCRRRPIKVLIVEDHQDMRELVRLVLESLDYVPIAARNGKKGVEKAISEKPKLILLDIRMPIMDGWEAAKALRAHPETNV